MCFKETKDLLNKLNSENIEKLKPILTRKLQDHYYLENLYEEEYNNLETFHKENRKE